jgi:hypothetical protein
MKSPPCKDCLCVPICKHKGYTDLFEDCSLLLAYEPNYYSLSGREIDHMKQIEQILKPNLWSYIYTMIIKDKEHI